MPESMTMPEEVYNVFAAVARAHRSMHQGDDDQRREATRRAVATIRARVRGTGPLDGSRWVHKTQHSTGAAPSKDAIAFVPEGPIENLRRAGMFIFDTINGSTREPNPPNMRGEFSEQFIIIVEPQDWMAPATDADDASRPVKQHAYDGGDNDTGTCDVCGRPRGDAIHTTNQQPAQGNVATVPDSDGLLQQLLESHKRQEQLLEQIRSLLQNGPLGGGGSREFRRAKTRKPFAGSVNDAE